MLDELIKTITEIQKLLEKETFASEADVSFSIIQPILQDLGWNTRTPEQVKSQYPFPEGGKKADFALMVNGAPHVIIEAKKIGNTANAEPQLFRYAYDAGALLAVLTDGQEWRIYLTFVPGSGGARLVHNLNLAERVPQEAAKILRRYISSNEVTAGKAAENAKHDLEKQINRQVAKKAIPDAWKELIDKENSPVVEALINETASNCGHPPDQKDVHEFLRGLTPQPESIHTPQKSRAPKIPARHNRPRISPSPHQSGNRNPFSYKLLGEAYYTRNFTEAYKEIHIHLAERDSTFLKRLEPEYEGAQGKKYLTRNISDIRRSSAEIISGWHLDTNLSSSSKEHYLKIACRVARIKFGKDLKIDF